LHIFSLLSIFWGNKFMAIRSQFVCVSLNLSPINFWIPETIFIKLGVHIVTPEPISTAYFIYLFHQPMHMYVYAPIVTRQRLSKNFTATTNTHSTM
jgi:hypothetical protein